MNELHDICSEVIVAVVNDDVQSCMVSRLTLGLETGVLMSRSWQQLCQLDWVWGARWSSGIDAAIGARGRGSRPVYYFTVQRPWTSR